MVWERWQEASEPSPHGLYVSDGGWTVIRTHGYGHAWLIAVSPVGHDTIRVGVGCCEPEQADDATAYIQDNHIGVSTAGLIWTIGASEYFFQHEDRPYFCFITGWGRRIILNLEDGQLVDESTLDGRFAEACYVSEHETVVPSLANAADELEDYDGNELFGGSRIASRTGTDGPRSKGISAW